MANTANATLTTDFNVAPYYDDYDENKMYYRMLFNPGYAVQARELTQMQTMLQKQIDRHSKHIFREGSIVLPGDFYIETDLDYVKIKDVDGANNAVAVSSYLNDTLTGATNGITAYVVDVATGSESDANTKTLFIRYNSGSLSSPSVKVFATSEVLTSNTNESLTVLDTSPTGKSSRFVIREGVLFAKEHFIRFDTQSIILSRYSNNPTCRVGFTITEQIVDSESDTSLLDPARGASNYAAPGADRLKLIPTLEVREISDETGAPEFVELFTIVNGVVTEKYDRSQYNILRDEMAKRTEDESGDYYVRGLSVRIRENLDTGNNGGLSLTGNNEYLSVGVEPGVAYVKGYEVNKLVTDYVTIRKALDYSNVSSQIGSTVMGSYVTLTQVSGTIVADTGEEISLYDNVARSIVNRTWGQQPSGNVIGTARVASIVYNSDTLGTANASVLLYLNDIRMTDVFANVRSVFLNHAGARANLVGDVLLSTSNNAILNDVRSGALLYPVGSTAVKTVRDPDGNPSLQFNFLRTDDVTVTGATGTFTVSLTTGAEGESTPYGSSSQLSAADKREIILTFNESANILASGTVTGSGTTLSGSSTNFTRFNVGDKFQVDGRVDNAANTYTIASITDDTTLTTVQTLPASINGNTWFKAYRAGDVVDLTTKGVDAGLERLVSTTSTAITVDLQETFESDFSATINYQVVRSGAREVQKLLRPSRFVKINCASHGYGTTGPYNLGISDIYQVKNIIRKSGSFPTTTADGTDVTTSFTIDNGQRDSFYDHGKITPNIRLGDDDRLLIELDYFEPSFTQGRGYFSIDSYPIDDTTVSSTTIRTEDIPFFVSQRDNSIYNLRNFLDFRPVKARTSADATTIGTATENPNNSSQDFTYETNGLRLPVPSTQYSYDYSFYYPRRDLVTIDKSGYVGIIRGTPTNYPITPTTPENVMALASIFVTPYPSLAPNYAKLLNRPDLSCVIKKMSNIRYTMRDIGLLKQRIDNLEYYASLSLLEKSAAEMKILDENGLERFKNGIFVDTFANHELGDTANPSYRIVVDPEEKVIRPFYTMNSIGYDYKNGTNIRKTGDLITLDYTEELMNSISQNVATSFRNVELSSYRFLGELFMNPDTDVWVDTDYAPDESIVQGSQTSNTATTQSLGITWGSWQTEWNEWQTRVTGYEAYNSKGQLVGTYATLAQAKARFDSDQTVKLTSSSQFLPPSGGSTYGTVTNVYVAGRFYSSYRLSQGDGLIYEVTSGSESGTSTRVGTETFLTTTPTTTTTTSTKVIDVALIPYIRPQTISIHARGLKPFTQVYGFFDNEEMSDYCRPISEDMYNGVIGASTTAAEGDDLITDGNGELYVNLRLPLEKRFRVGTKEVVFTDSPTNSIDASTKAIAYFVAQGLVQQKQNTILTTRGYTTTQSTRTISQSANVTNSPVTNKRFVAFVEDDSCSAYSFIPKAPIGEEGIFLTSVDIFFAAKHPNLGVWVEIREMDNAGGITRNQVPFSEVWIPADDIVTSSDASLAQKITFPSPVFLYSDVQYAFVIHTVGINPDTYFWVARLGETNIANGRQHTSRPLTGTFYTTNNNLNWDMVPDLDLKIRFYRASFVTNVTGEAVIGNKPTEEVVLANVSTALTSFGETFMGRFRMTLSGNTASISANDIVIGQTSGANATVINIDSNIITVSNTQFQLNERINLYWANAVSMELSSLITNIDGASGKLQRYKTKDYIDYGIAEFTSSNGKFVVGDVITGLQSGANAVVSEIRNMRYSVVDFEPSYLTFNKTTIGFQMKTTSNTMAAGTYFDLNDNENYYFNTERAILSKSNEVGSLGGSPSNNVKVTMRSTTTYLSPVVDLGRTHSIYVDNIINANTYAEDATGVVLNLTGNVANIVVNDVLVGANSGGNSIVTFVSGNNFTVTVPNTAFLVSERVNIYDSSVVSKAQTSVILSITKDNKKVGGELFNKYICTPITLAEGQDAEDLLVFLTAYKPPGTDIKVWAKVLHNEDSEAFAYLPWIELASSETTSYSSLSNKNDFIELRYTFGESSKTGPNGEVQYKNSEGITFTGFKYYAIKIGLLANDSAIVPRVGDLRVIAIQI